MSSTPSANAADDPDPFALIARLGVVPVIAIESAADAVPLADSLLEGGLPVAEITFRTASAAEVLARLHESRPELTIGAGTLLDNVSLDAARRSGARFGLAPGFDPDLVARARELGFPFAPGVMTPSELNAAQRSALRVLKFFPAAITGGPAALEAIAAPFAHLELRFIPTGGVSEKSIGEWLRMPSVLAVGGTWIARAELLREGRWAEISTRARAARDAVDRARESWATQRGAIRQ